MTEKERELFKTFYTVIEKSTANRKHNEGNENYHTIVPFGLIFNELTHKNPDFGLIKAEVSSVIHGIEDCGKLLTDNNLEL